MRCLACGSLLLEHPTPWSGAACKGLAVHTPTPTAGPRDQLLEPQLAALPTVRLYQLLRCHRPAVDGRNCANKHEDWKPRYVAAIPYPMIQLTRDADRNTIPHILPIRINVKCSPKALRRRTTDGIATARGPRKGICILHHSYYPH
jgi:hypothetical protein